MYPSVFLDLSHLRIVIYMCNEMSIVENFYKIIMVWSIPELDYMSTIHLDNLFLDIMFVCRV